MQLTVKKHSCACTNTLGSVSWYQLVRLEMRMGVLLIDTIGYLCSSRRFVVVAGAPLGIVDVDPDTVVEILKSGTLTLEIQCN